MDQTVTEKIIVLTPHTKTEPKKFCPRRLLYTILALWCQYLSLAALALYTVLRLLLAPDVPPGQYSGPLELLWPVSYVLLLTSFLSDRLLWRKDWEECGTAAEEAPEPYPQTAKRRYKKRTAMRPAS